MNSSTYKFAVMAVAWFLAGGQVYAGESGSPVAKHPSLPAQAKLVDINAANRAELMTLPGIHAAEAERIIAGRPYGSKAWLVSKNIISEGVYLGLRTNIIALQHVPIATKPASAAKAHPK